MKNVTHLLPTGEIKEAAPLPQWKTPYNHDTNLVSDLTALYCADESKTKQEFVEEQDINKIMERLLRGAQQAEVALPEHFTDMTGKLDYFTMQNKIRSSSPSIDAKLYYAANIADEMMIQHRRRFGCQSSAQSSARQ